MKAVDFPNLTQFLGGWFHQDWLDEGYENPEDVVRAYAKDESSKAVRGTMAEIEKLLAHKLPPTQMRRLLGDDLGCAYDPTVEDKTYRAWLREVLVLLQEKPR